MRVLRDLLLPVLLNEPPLQRIDGLPAYSADNRRRLGFLNNIVSSYQPCGIAYVIEDTSAVVWPTTRRGAPWVKAPRHDAFNEHSPSATTQLLQPLGCGPRVSGITRRIVASVAVDQGRLSSILRPFTTPMLLPKQIPTRPLHPLMWIGVVVILVVIALVNGCGA